ncbi:MAG TPA: GNAT family N-acetyltransferase [Usitatibacter sp.]|jgi:ribosomal protein S18 acetylase RimI-like enzyme|nr:GNAT family N-acetyltransferase [Usitatibacter sp.]
MRLEPGATPIPGITLREALPSDEGLLRRLYRSSREPELDAVQWSDAQKAAFCDSQFALQDRFYRDNYGGMQMLVIERDAAPVGRLYVHSTPAELNLMDITLDPAVRGQGLGTSLIEWVQREAGREARQIILHVEMYNRARALYRRLGFEEATSEGIYLLMRWRPCVKPG